jgi:hypothetical protein
MTTTPTHRTPITPADLLMVKHSGLCDAGTVKHVPTRLGFMPVKVGCTCGAGFLRLLVGG